MSYSISLKSSWFTLLVLVWRWNRCPSPAQCCHNQSQYWTGYYKITGNKNGYSWKCIVQVVACDWLTLEACSNDQLNKTPKHSSSPEVNLLCQHITHNTPSVSAVAHAHSLLMSTCFVVLMETAVWWNNSWKRAEERSVLEASAETWSAPSS